MRATKNVILDSLPDAVFKVLDEYITPIELVQGTILQEAGAKVRQVYFPTAGMVSLLVVTASGEEIEAGIVGREGVVSANIATLDTPSFLRGAVQIQGAGFRIAADRFREIYAAHHELRRKVDGYQAFLTIQGQQNAACRSMHSLEGRLCRWLLQCRDVTGSDTITLTQEFLSHMLGVRRPTVSVAANALQGDRLIRYKRGAITILDKKAMSARSCECYRVLREQYEICCT